MRAFEGAMHEHLRIPDDKVLCMVISDVLGVSAHKVTPEAALVVDLHATSLDFLEIVVGVEDAFHIEISDREAAKLVHVGDFEALIRRRRAEKEEKSTPLLTRATHDR
jgi:acyl carrier protein